MAIDWLKNRLRSWLEVVTTKANPVAFIATQAGTSTNEEPQPFDLAAHLKVVIVNVYAYACMRAIARDVSSTPLNIERRVRKDGEWAWDRVEQHELVDLIDFPNPTQSLTELQEVAIFAMLATGNGYLARDRQARELHYVQPDWVTIRTNTGEVSGYKVKNRGREFVGDINDLIHFKLANPENIYYGLAPSRVIERTITAKIHLNKYINSYFKNNGVLGTILTTEDDLSEEQIAILRKQFDRLHQGSEKSFKAGFFGNGMKVEQLVNSLKELIPVELDMMVMREVCAAYGVPPIKIMSLQDASYANANKQDQIYERGTCEPIRRVFEQAITLQLIRPDYGPEYRAHYDRSVVPGLQDDENEKTKRLSTQWKDGVITRNEYRTTAGWAPVDEEDGGEEFYRAPAPMQLPEGVDEGDSGGDKSMPSRLKSSDDPYVTIWKAHDRRLRKEEKPFADRMSVFFEGQYRRLIDNINEVTGKGAMMSRLALYVTKADEPPKNADAIFNLKEENALLAAEVTPIIREIVERSGQEAINNLSIDLAFNVHNPSVEVVTQALKNRILGINETSYKDIKKILLDAYDSGESVDVVARRLREKYDFFSRTRSKTIARTEMNSMVSAGRHHARLQVQERTGLQLRKRWIATRDAKVRPAHSHADMQERRLTEPYDVGGDQLMFPGDTSGRAANVINCRCADEEFIEDDQQ